MLSILYLEDDINLSNTIEEFLEDNAFNVVTTYNSKDTLEKLYEKNFDLLILDVNLPDMSGFELLEHLRKAKIDIPTIFTTTLDDIDSLEKGYELGADDYLRKPFLLKELLHRINAIIKRKYNSIDSIIKLPSNYTFNIISNILAKDGEDISLNNKELSLLKLFIQNRNQIVPSQLIYDTLWSASEQVSDASLRTYIVTLRKLFGKDSITNIKKQGYKFII